MNTFVQVFVFGIGCGTGFVLASELMHAAREFFAGLLESRYGALCVCGHGEKRHWPHCRICHADTCAAFREDDEPI